MKSSFCGAIETSTSDYLEDIDNWYIENNAVPREGDIFYLEYTDDPKSSHAIVVDSVVDDEIVEVSRYIGSDYPGRAIPILNYKGSIEFEGDVFAKDLANKITKKFYSNGDKAAIGDMFLVISRFGPSATAVITNILKDGSLIIQNINEEPKSVNYKNIDIYLMSGKYLRFTYDDHYIKIYDQYLYVYNKLNNITVAQLLLDNVCGWQLTSY